MKLHYLYLLIALPALMFADDFQRRYGVNSQIYDTPLYFTQNKHIPCANRTIHYPQKVQHPRPCDEAEEELMAAQPNKFSRRSKNKELIEEKSREMREKQESLERERQKLESELAALNTEAVK